MAKKSAPKEASKVDTSVQATPVGHPPGLLAAAVSATQTGAPCFASMADITPLLTTTHGQLVEYNDAIKDATGLIAVRATAIGVQVYNGNGVQPPQPVFNHPALNPVSAPFMASAPVVGGINSAPKTFVFKKGIPIPPARKGNKSSNQYGFDTMEIGDCFDIMPTAADPEPYKRFSSTAAAASKRLKPKKFLMRTIEENGVKFARTWRTE